MTLVGNLMSSMQCTCIVYVYCVHCTLYSVRILHMASGTGAVFCTSASAGAA